MSQQDGGRLNVFLFSKKLLALWHRYPSSDTGILKYADARGDEDKAYDICCNFNLFFKRFSSKDVALLRWRTIYCATS